MIILVINPGATSTKIAIFRNKEKSINATISHSVEELSKYKCIADQKDFRKSLVLDFLKQANISLVEIDEFVGRGGMVRNLDGGVYKINHKYVRDALLGVNGQHASNLGAVIADELAKQVDKDKFAYTVDPVVVDEYSEVARISGMADISRVRSFHALNHKAVAIRYAKCSGVPLNRLNLIVAHLGSGISVGAHKNGRVVDVNSALGGDGPMSPERAGGVPPLALIDMCFSGKYTYQQMYKKLIGEGGVFSYLGTKNMIETEKRIKNGDKKASLILNALAYQVAKEIGACASVLKGDVDAIILTGSIARSDIVVNEIKKHVNFITKNIIVYPGEDEMNALALGVYDVVSGERPVLEY